MTPEWWLHIWRQQRFLPGTWIIDFDCAVLVGSADPEVVAVNDNTPDLR